MIVSLTRFRWLLSLGTLAIFALSAGCGHDSSTNGPSAGERSAQDKNLIPSLEEDWSSESATQRTPPPILPAMTESARESSPAEADVLSSSSTSSECSNTGAEVSSCEMRDVSSFGLFEPRAGRAAMHQSGTPTVEDVLQQGLRLAGASPTHLAVRGTASRDSLRCEWRGIVRTMEQRDNSIRYWLGLGMDEAIPDRTYLELLFTISLDTIVPEYLETAKSNFLAMARGGLSTEYLFLTCYADFAVTEYLLGDGPTTLTLAYDRMGEAAAYELYRREHLTGQFGTSAILSEGEHQFDVDGTRSNAESSLADMIEGYESVVFLAPMGAHNAIAVEAWQAVAQWDLQTDEDGVLQAVRYEAPQTDPEHTQPYTELKSRIVTSTASDAYAGMRIANISGLEQYYRDIGAYGDITPGDSATTTFTPSRPPPVPTCSGVAAVPDPRLNSGLVRDCTALLDSMAALRGTATLDWNASTTITSWEGITLNANSARVTALELDDEGLDGTIPSGLGSLSALETLDLSDNDLTGAIPAELGRLWRLQTLRLSGNRLTGCISAGLESVATSDLASLNLPYCSPPAPGNLTATPSSETAVTLSWDAVSNIDLYRLEYRGGPALDWTVVATTSTSTSQTMSDLRCDGRYLFRVGAHGSGTRYAADWSEPSAPVLGTPSECVPPTFGTSTYTFSVTSDAGVGTPVGTTTATGSVSGESVTYWIDGDDRFTIASSTGAITVSRDLSGLAGTSTDLTVRARDESGGTAAATVSVTVIRGCSGGVAVPNPGGNPDLLNDCRTLLGARDRLAGTATLNWSGDVAMSSWDGVTVRGTPGRVTRLQLARDGLTGSIPPELGSLTELTSLDLSGNTLTGGIPPDLGGLTELERLFLYGNRLSGEIPSELGGLASLTRLYLQDNQLSGGIPPELGGLTDLFHLWLYGNRLSGTIPWELVNLTGLELLLLGRNDLEGCVPQGLRNIRLNDIAGLGLLDCVHGLVSAPTGLEVSVGGGGFTLTWDAVTGAGLYEVQYIEGSGGAWDVIGTTTATSTGFAPDGGAACGSTYRFRVRAHGDAQTHAAGWGPESSEVPATTAACNRLPEFATSTYIFSVSEDAAASTVVGTVSATDADSDTLEFRFISGTPAGSFSVGTTTGDIAVAMALDHETVPFHGLTVEASDGRGGSATATVNIMVTDVAEDAPPAPTGLGASLTDGEFSLSWDVVTGASHYEPQYRDDPTGNWDAIGTTTATSTSFSPVGDPACGTTYLFRVRAYGDGVTYAPTWSAESGEEPVTTGACNRAPEFATSTYSFSIAEDAATSTVVGTVLATDADDGRLEYRITSGNPAGSFAVGTTTGEVAVAGMLDYETAPSHA